MEDEVTEPERAAQYREAGLWTEDTMASRLARWAQGPDAERLAVADQAGTVCRSYGQLARDSAQLAACLSAHGVATGEVVSVQLPNWYETVVTALAVNAVGAVLNPLLPNYRLRELSHVFRTAGPHVIFTPQVYRDFDYLELIDQVQNVTGVDPLHIVVKGSGGDLELAKILDGGEKDASLASGRNAKAVSELIFTSGTEASPKAIMHTEETANFAVRALQGSLDLDDHTVVWMPSPVGHSTGFNYGIRLAVYHGYPLVLQDRWSPTEAIELIERYACTYTLAATTFLEDLVSECERRSTRLPSMAYFGCGGAPVPASLVERASKVGMTVLRLYGSTEVLCATWNRPWSPEDKRRGTDGYALSDTEVEVRADDGTRLFPPAVGELHTRGPNTSVGFYRDPERTASAYLQGGWVRSGDLAQLDADGYITIVGRKKDIIIRGGVNIAPREIEDMIIDFPEVVGVAVIGLPDERLGERSCACVVLAQGAELDLKELTQRLRELGLATYKLPERLEKFDALPRTPSGKVQKFELVNQLIRSP